MIDMDPERAQDLLAESRSLVIEASSRGMALRMMGGIAILDRCPTAGEPPLAREYNDIDFAGLSADSNRLIEMFEELGYTSERRFNSLHGHRRLLFKTKLGRHVDVLLDHFEMCHKLDMRERIELESPTLPLADLAVMKLQVVEANRKDLTDMVALFADHDISDDSQGIDGGYIAGLCSNDWGLWKTLIVSGERLIAFARELDNVPVEAIEHRIAELLRRINDEPKGRRWKMRARVGERTKWYELPEEVG